MNIYSEPDLIDPLELRVTYNKIRSRTVEICSPLSTEDYVPQPALFTSPPKWHLAHTTWFFEEMILKKLKLDYKVYDNSFGFLFNSYYNSIGERTARHQRGLITRPTVDQVYQFRAYIDSQMADLFDGIDNKELKELVTLGLNHEQQHQELLLTDLKYSLSQNPLYPVYSEKVNYINQRNKDSGWIDLDEGIYEVGHQGQSFCFDNEHGRHKTYIQNVQINKSLVTNGEFIEFIESGGYNNFRFWLDEGWSWVNESKAKAPMYWKKVDSAWHHFTLNGLQPIANESIIAHVNYYEAAAFATWKGMRLPTEFEWEAASPKIKWGQRWEWTNSAYLPYPGFKIAEGAVGEYNSKFMINQMVLRGASIATAEGHSRQTYRNFFHPQYQWQFTGIRLAR